MATSKQEQRRPSKEFNITLLGIVLCVQIVGSLAATWQGKWIVAGALAGLVALSLMVLPGLVRSRST